MNNGKTTETVLSPADALNQLQRAILAGARFREPLKVCIRLLEQVSPDSIQRFDREIGWAMPSATARIKHDGSFFGRLKAALFWWREPSYQLGMFELLEQEPDLAWLLLSHRYGYLREAALNSLNRPPSSPFFLSLLIFRLNDWVPEVRAASQACLARLLTRIDATVISAVTPHILARAVQWRRWQGAPPLLDEMIFQDSVLDKLAVGIQDSLSGAQAMLLRLAMRRHGMDRHIPLLARQAVQPSVRACALKILLEGQVTWPTHYERVWIDKSSGRDEWRLAYAKRSIEHSFSLEELSLQGARDKSAFVRKIAATALVQNRHTLGNRDEIIALLKDDRSSAVRSAVDFVIRDLKAAADAVSPVSS